jgi:translation elongation factor EF-Tu-like GTPase
VESVEGENVRTIDKNDIMRGFMVCKPRLVKKSESGE